MNINIHEEKFQLESKKAQKLLLDLQSTTDNISSSDIYQIIKD